MTLNKSFTRASVRQRVSLVPANEGDTVKLGRLPCAWRKVVAAGF